MYFFFYYPVGVETDREGQPWLSWLLMLTMIASFVFFQLRPMALMERWEWWVYFPHEGLKPGMLLSIFTHNSWLHLLGNLLYLGVFAPSLEQALGRLRFGLLFCFLGLFGNLFQALVSEYWLTDQAGFGIVGASGAISGLMALFLLRFPYARIKTVWVIFSPLHGLVKTGILPISSILAIMTWIAFQAIALSTKLLGAGLDYTAYGAHFGGLFCGLLLGAGLGLPREGRTFRWRFDAQRRFGRGDWMGAYEAIQPLLASENPEDLTLAARASRLVGNERQTLELYRKAIQVTLKQGDEVGAAASYAEALRFYPGLFFEEEVQFRLILALERLGEEGTALQAIHLYRAIYTDEDHLSVLLLRGAKLEEEMDPDAACKLYQEHIERFPASPYDGMAREALRQLSGA